EAALTLIDTVTTPEQAAGMRTKLQGMLDAGNTSIGIEMALAAVDLKEGKTDEAFEKIKALTEKAPEYIPAHSALGALAASKGDLALAEAELKRAAELSPARSTRRLQYAQFLIQKGDTAAGKAAIEEMTRQTPDYLPAWLHLAQLAAAEQDYENSRTLVGRVLSRDAAHPDALLLSAR